MNFQKKQNGHSPERCEEYEVSEISEVLEMEENAVRVNLMRARQKVKNKLQLMNYEQRQFSR